MTPGTILKETREKKGLSIEDVSRATRILREYIEALESDDYPALPSETHTKGFIRKYARFLGIDPEELVSLYERQREEQRVSFLKTVVESNVPVVLPYLLSMLITVVASVLLTYVFSIPAVKETFHPSVKAEVKPIVLEVGPLPEKESMLEMEKRLANITSSKNVSAAQVQKPVVPIFTPSSPVENEFQGESASRQPSATTAAANATGPRKTTPYPASSEVRQPASENLSQEKAVSGEETPPEANRSVEKATMPEPELSEPEPEENQQVSAQENTTQ